MKNLFMKMNFKFILALFTLAIFVSCNDDNDDPTTDGPTPTGVSMTYDLNESAVAGISGTAKFIENSDASVTVELSLTGTPDGGQHPAHIHVNTAAEGGSIAITLGAVDGTTGTSTITFSALDNGTAITYTQLIDFDGYINVHLSATELGTIVAQGDIGQNELTGTTKEYALGEKAVAGISGTATFYERVNGEALAILRLTGTPDGGVHPAHIHNGEASVGGSIAFSFNPVNGTTGWSATNVAALDNEDAFGYADVLTFDGYINVHLSATELSTIVAQGNIGANEGVVANTTVTYAVTNSGASAYIFNGAGLTNSSNPDLTLKRGMTYEFDMSTPGHPFLIKTTQTTGTGDQYTNGVTNAGAVSGIVSFTVPQSAPNTLFYICEFHGSMTGTLTITD